MLTYSTCAWRGEEEMPIRLAGLFPVFAGICGLLLSPPAIRADYQVLHTFTYTTGGDTPLAAPTVVENVLYGTTSADWTSGVGTVFSMNSDGSAFKLLHTFNNTDGAMPSGSLVLSGSALYGLTGGGGANNGGTVFRVNTDGTGFQLVHSFSPASDGSEYRTA